MLAQFGYFTSKEIRYAHNEEKVHIVGASEQLTSQSQKMPARPTCSLLGLRLGLRLGLGSGSPSWFTRLVLQQLFRSQGRENILAAASSSKQAAASKQLSSFLPIRISPSA